jgi:hypothetical protein
MRIERFEDIEAWQLAREWTRKVYRLTKRLGKITIFGRALLTNWLDEPVLLFVDLSPISKKMKSAKRFAVNPELE